MTWPMRSAAASGRARAAGSQGQEVTQGEIANVRVGSTIEFREEELLLLRSGYVR